MDLELQQALAELKAVSQGTAAMVARQGTETEVKLAGWIHSARVSEERYEAVVTAITDLHKRFLKIEKKLGIPSRRKK